MNLPASFSNRTVRAGRRRPTTTPADERPQAEAPQRRFGVKWACPGRILIELTAAAKDRNGAALPAAPAGGRRDRLTR